MKNTILRILYHSFFTTLIQVILFSNVYAQSDVNLYVTDSSTKELDAVKENIIHCNDKKLRPKITLNYIFLSSKLGKLDEENWATTLLFAEAPQSPEANLIWKIMGQNKVAKSITDNFISIFNKKLTSDPYTNLRAATTIFEKSSEKIFDTDFLLLVHLYYKINHINKYKTININKDAIDKEALEAVLAWPKFHPGIIKLDNDDFQKALYGFFFDSTNPEFPRRNGTFAVKRAAILAENHKFKDALALLEACQTETDTFEFLFCMGWLRAIEKNHQGARVCFEKIVKGKHPADQRDIAADSLRMMENQILSKIRVFVQFQGAFQSLALGDPMEYMGTILYSPNDKVQHKALFLLNTEENRFELALYKNNNHWFQLLTSRFATKFYSQKKELIFTFDGQPMLPGIPKAPKWDRIKGIHDIFGSLASSIDWDNPQKVQFVHSLKNLTPHQSSEFPIIAGYILSQIEKNGLFYEIQTQSPIDQAVYFTFPNFQKCVLDRYGIEMNRGKITGGRFGSIRLEGFAYSPKGFGDAVSRHFPNVPVDSSQKHENLLHLVSLIQLFF